MAPEKEATTSHSGLAEVTWHCGGVMVTPAGAAKLIDAPVAVVIPELDDDPALERQRVRRRPDGDVGEGDGRRRDEGLGGVGHGEDAVVGRVRDAHRDGGVRVPGGPGAERRGSDGRSIHRHGALGGGARVCSRGCRAWRRRWRRRRRRWTRSRSGPETLVAPVSATVTWALVPARTPTVASPGKPRVPGTVPPPPPPPEEELQAAKASARPARTGRCRMPGRREAMWFPSWRPVSGHAGATSTVAPSTRSGTGLWVPTPPGPTRPGCGQDTRGTASPGHLVHCGAQRSRR